MSGPLPEMVDTTQCTINDRKRKAGDDQEQCSRAAKVFNITTTQVKSSDPFLEALLDVQRANERAIAVSGETVRGMTHESFARKDTSNIPPIVEVTDMIRASTAKINASIDDMKNIGRGGAICDLPAEIVIQIFTLLDTDSRFNCQATCHSWREMLKQKNLWNGADYVVHGTLGQIDAQWNRVKRISPSPTSMSVHVWMSPFERKLEQETIWKTFKLCDVVKDFSTSSLQEYRHKGRVRGADEYIWEALLNCSSLKLLHWYSRGEYERRPDHNYNGTPYSFAVKNNSALAKCKLEDFSFDVIMGSNIYLTFDDAFLAMLTQVKRLRIGIGLSRSVVIKIITSARGSIENLTICGSYRRGGRPYEEPLVMDQLRRIHLEDDKIETLPIIAPKTIEARFGHGSVVDWTLLDSCRSTLRKLHIQVRGIQTKGRLGQEIFDMPQLQDLSLDYRHEDRWSVDLCDQIVARYEDHSVPAFWRSIRESSVEVPIKRILPELRSLTVIHDPMLDQDLIVRLLDVVDKEKIEKIVVLLANHCSDDTTGLDRLQQDTPAFTYKQFDEWKDDTTKKWSLTSSLLLADYSRIHWSHVDDCRNNLREIKVYLRDTRYDEQFTQELFNMPKLESLILDFSKEPREKYQSVNALWSAMRTGDTHRHDISMKDILPKLEELEVVNDAVLDEEIIGKFLAIRKEHELSPIRSMRIDLASDHSDRTSRLEHLAKNMEGFSYKCFKDWSPQAGESPDIF